jgi:creatinine amidohydrolase
VRIRDLNWMQVQDYLQHDDRIVLPVGSTEQHAYISLETDNIIAERLAVEAAEPLGVPVLPVLAYGVTGFSMFPGSPTLRPETFGAVVRDILDSLHAQGFRRFFVANGHSGNTPDAASAWAEEHGDAAVLWHEVWDGRPDEVAAAIDEEYDHASWSENFPWTRLEALGDGSFGGLYQRPDEDVLRVWNVAVEELRARLDSGWP